MTRARIAPDSFQITPELYAWAAKNAPDVDLERATDMFKDHEFARPYSHWDATWRNWMRKAQDGLGPFKSKRHVAQKQSQALFDELEAAHERKRARLQLVPK